MLLRTGYHQHQTIRTHEAARVLAATTAVWFVGWLLVGNMAQGGLVLKLETDLMKEISHHHNKIFNFFPLFIRNHPAPCAPTRRSLGDCLEMLLFNRSIYVLLLYLVDRLRSISASLQLRHATSGEGWSLPLPPQHALSLWPATCYQRSATITTTSYYCDESFIVRTHQRHQQAHVTAETSPPFHKLRPSSLRISFQSRYFILPLSMVQGVPTRPKSVPL